MSPEPLTFDLTLRAIVGMLALVAPLICLHLWAFQKRSRRGFYLVVLLPLLIVTAFIPLIVSDPKFGVIQVWWSYLLIFSPGLYLESGLLPLYLTSYGVAAAQNILCVSVATWMTKRKEPIQSPQRNAGSRPSSGDSPASETPSSLGPRG